MSKFRPSPEEVERTHLQPQPVISKSALIVAYLQQMALPSMWPRELTEDDYRLWDNLLKGYSVKAIKFAFDSWIQGARKFPLPVDIETMCISYQEQEEVNSYPKPHRGRLDGGHAQILMLWNMVNDRIADFRENKTAYIPLTDTEIEGMVAKTKDGGYIPRRSGTATHFPNGNAKYNHELTQARALQTIGRRRA